MQRGSSAGQGCSPLRAFCRRSAAADERRSPAPSAANEIHENKARCHGATESRRSPIPTPEPKRTRLVREATHAADEHHSRKVDDVDHWWP
jgi:hypothetical protein